MCGGKGRGGGGGREEGSKGREKKSKLTESVEINIWKKKKGLSPIGKTVVNFNDSHVTPATERVAKKINECVSNGKRGEREKNL